jgi:N-acylneuraminate cytidylyltransferase
MTSPIAIIPARGGSKRIPRKNLKPFAGRPMIEHTLEAARASGCFGRIIVSTDDAEIAELALRWGAEVPALRPAALSDDHATTADVLVHALTELVPDPPAHACCIYATAPLLQPRFLREGHSVLVESGASVAFSVTSFPYPILRALRRDEDGSVAMMWPEHRSTRSNDLPEAFHDAGQFYWVNVPAFLAQRQLFTPDAHGVRIPRKFVQDIDTPEDWDTAEALFRALGGTPA